MSESHEPHSHEAHSHVTESWLDRWWQLLVILFGVLFVTLLVSYHPFL